MLQALHELEPITMAELVLESHHRGRVLFAKITEVLQTSKTVSTAAIEDSKEDVECLKVTFAGMNNPGLGHSWPETGSWVVVKEPYLTLDEHHSGLACIRIDHPSDLVESDAIRYGRISKHLLPKAIAKQGHRDALQRKKDGNDALKATGLGHRAHLNAQSQYIRGLQVLADHADPENTIMTSSTTFTAHELSQSLN